MDSSKLSAVAFLAFLVLASVSLVACVDPFQPGKHQVNSTTILQVEGLQLDHNLRVYAPNEPGSFKVIYFLSGFDCTCIRLKTEL